MTIRLDPTTLRLMWPRAKQSKIDAVCEVSEHCFAAYGIDDWEVVVQLMANITHENGAGTIVRESGAYRPQRIIEIFGFYEGKWRSSAKVTNEEAYQLAGHPEALFDRVYNLPKSPKLAHELGNHEPGDGYKYRGGGDLQLTGRGSYERIGNLIGRQDIVDNPDILADPKVSFEVACAEFEALGCIPWAKKGNTVKVRRLVNGGNNGMTEVQALVPKWREALPDVESPPLVPRGADTDNKTIMGSKIMKGVVTTAVTSAIGAGSKVAENANTETHTVSINDVADKIQSTAGTVSDTISTVQVAADHTTAIVQTVKPFLGVPPNMWATIAFACAALALVTVAYTGWQRYAKWRDQGV